MTVPMKAQIIRNACATTAWLTQAPDSCSRHGNACTQQTARDACDQATSPRRRRTEAARRWSKRATVTRRCASHGRRSVALYQPMKALARALMRSVVQGGSQTSSTSTLMSAGATRSSSALDVVDDDVGDRAGRGSHRQQHVQPVIGDGDAVDQADVDDGHGDFRVDDPVQGVLDGLAHRGRARVGIGQRCADRRSRWFLAGALHRTRSGR